MLQFFLSTINHSPAYIKSSLFKKFGFYDEELKICSDWKWYLQTVVYGNVNVRFVDCNVTIFDGDGISETNLSLRYAEREKVLKEILPPRLYQDYQDWAFPITQLKRLKRWHLYGVFYFVERVLFKVEKWSKILITKK